MNSGNGIQSQSDAPHFLMRAKVLLFVGFFSALGGFFIAPDTHAQAAYPANDSGLAWWCSQYTDAWSLADYLSIKATDGSGTARAEVGDDWVDIDISARVRYCSQPGQRYIPGSPRAENVSGHSGTTLGAGSTTIWYTNDGTGNVQESGAVRRPLYIAGRNSGCFNVMLQFNTMADGSGFNIYPSPQSAVSICLQRYTTYSLAPSITGIPNAIEPGQTVAVTGNVAKTGSASTTSPTDTRYIRIIYKSGQSAPSNSAGGTSASGPCAYYGMTGGNAARCSEHISTPSATFNNFQFSGTGRVVPQFSDTTPEDFNVGDRICYGLSVRGYNESTGPTKSGTRYSALQCVVVGKKPKVHVTGGDVIVRGGGTASNVTTSVTRHSKERVEIDAPQTSFSGLRLTGVDSNGNKLPANSHDPHWIIDRVYRPAGYGGDTCQWASTGPSGSGAVIEIPSSSSSTPISARTVSENGAGYAGVYMATDPALTGNLVNVAVNGLNGQSVWNRVSPNASWIAQNTYGQNWAQNSCPDPTFYASTDINRANIYVFKLKDGFYINNNEVILDTAKIHIKGAVDNLVKFYVNGNSLGDWQNPGWTPTSQATSNAGGPGVFKHGKNELEIHVQSTYSHTGILIDELKVEAKMLSAAEADIYGSWSEYGTLASGRISGMASGAGYASGVHVEGIDSVDFCSLSLLSFANQNNTDVCVTANVGGYVLPATVRTIVDRYASRTTSPMPNSVSVSALAGTSGGYRPVNGNPITLLPGTIPAGRTVVINAPDNDIIINGDLTYTAGTINGPAETPQLVIIGRNITINEGVGRVDAWLVAKTAGHGAVYTCDVLPASLTASRCAGQLTVNGPVIANTLHLRRTAGATRTDGASPAEVFNLRPDAYIWGVNQGIETGRMPTVMITELPPRF